MPLSSGDKLGPYEILSAIGAGGMGEVYRAKDTKLGRQVAIKVLPGHLAANPSARKRHGPRARAPRSLGRRRAGPSFYLQGLRNRRRARRVVPGDGVHLRGHALRATERR